MSIWKSKEGKKTMHNTKIRAMYSENYSPSRKMWCNFLYALNILVAGIVAYKCALSFLPINKIVAFIAVVIIFTIFSSFKVLLGAELVIFCIIDSYLFSLFLVAVLNRTVFKNAPLDSIMAYIVVGVIGFLFCLKIFLKIYRYQSAEIERKKSNKSSQNGKRSKRR